MAIAAEQRRQLAASRAHRPLVPMSRRESEHQQSAGRADMASSRAGIAPEPRSNAVDDLFQSLPSWWETHLQAGAGGASEQVSDSQHGHHIECQMTEVCLFL